MGTMFGYIKSCSMTKKDLLKDYVRKDFYYSNIDKYRRYFDEWYDGLTEIQLEFWQRRMEGQIC